MQHEQRTYREHDLKRHKEGRPRGVAPNRRGDPTTGADTGRPSSCAPAQVHQKRQATTGQTTLAAASPVIAVQWRLVADPAHDDRLASVMWTSGKR